MADEVISYQQGHVKRDPVSGVVAIRTIFADADQAWLVATLIRGAYFAKTGDVSAWEDLFVPPVPE